MLSWKRRVGIGAALVVVLWLASSFAVLQMLRRRSSPPRSEPAPATWAGRCEELRLETTDGERLGAWFVDAPRSSGPSVVVLHGKGGSRTARIGVAEVFQRLGCATLLVTHRAHGDSTGASEDFGWSARLDVLAAVEWIERRRPGRPILICGASLGGAAAVFAALELGPRVRGYWLECVYDSLEMAAWRRCEMHLPPLLDRVAFAGLLTVASVCWPQWRSIAPRAHISEIPAECFVWLLAGGADRHAPLDGVRELAARSSGRARLIVIDGAEHDRLLLGDPTAYERAALEFVRAADDTLR